MDHSRAEKGLKREYSRVKKAFQCTRPMGVSVPSLHRESTDSLIRLFHAALWLERAPFREMVMLSTTDYWCKH